MKVTFMGPRNTRRLTDKFGWISVDVDMASVPHPDDHVILDGGSSYVVRYVMWFVNSEVRNTDEWTLEGDVKGPGWIEAVHVNITPQNQADQARLTRRIHKADQESGYITPPMPRNPDKVMKRMRRKEKKREQEEHPS